MERVKFRRIIVFCLLLLVTACVDYLGGNFSGDPEKLEDSISADAKAMLEQAFADVPSDALVDHHVHIIGLDEKQGTTVNPRLFSKLHPIDWFKTKLYMSGAKVDDLDKANEEYVTRLVRLIRADKHHGKYHLLAFDHYYNPDGSINEEKSEFYTSNEYVVKLANEYPDIFEPVISVHPYRKDAVEELTRWAEKGVRWVKWLPNAQGMNASLERNDAYYATMKRHDMILLTHVGEEQAVDAEEDQALGNPLLFRRPLDKGVRVVMAHCASLGKDKDLDNPGKEEASFNLFLRMMDEPRYNGLLFGEISAMTQVNRLPTPLLTMLKRTDLHPRLLNGSDYPLPALNAVIHLRTLVKYGMLKKEDRKPLKEIYKYNPLLFDYVLKRMLISPETGKGFPPVVFKGIDAPERNIPWQESRGRIY